VSLSPSTITADQMPAEVRIEGRGLSNFARVQLSGEGDAKLTPVVVEVGGVRAEVTRHVTRDEIYARFPALPPGDYDVRVAAGSKASVTSSSVFRVEPAFGNNTDVSQPTDEPISASRDDEPSSGGAPSAITAAPVTPSSDAARQEPPEAGARSDARDTAGVVDGAVVDGAVADGAVVDGAVVDGAVVDGAVADGAAVDAGFDGAGQTSDPLVADAGDEQTGQVECATGTGTLLFYDDYELGDLSRWTFGGNVNQNTCQATEINGDRPYEGALAFSSTLTCSPESGQPEHYASLQFAGNEVLRAFDNTKQGIDAHDGVLLSFEVWADLGFTLGADQWASFLLLSGTCDWSDTVLSVAALGSGEPLAISHGDVDGGLTYDFPFAPPFPERQWTRITVYVNYHEQVITVWQNGMAISRAEFVRPGKRLCHVWIGAAFGGESVDSQVYQDDVRIWRLSKPLRDADVEPCLAVER
jgi:hypothetical protein